MIKIPIHVYIPIFESNFLRDQIEIALKLGFDEENDQMIVSVNPPRAEEEEPEIVPEGEEGEVVEGEDSSSDQDDADNDSSEEAESSD